MVSAQQGDAELKLREAPYSLSAEHIMELSEMIAQPPQYG